MSHVQHSSHWAKVSTSVGLFFILSAQLLSGCDHDSPCSTGQSEVIAGPPLFDSGGCSLAVLSGDSDETLLSFTIAECRTGDSLFRPCDEAFVNWCIEGGGDFSPLEGQEFHPSSDPLCATGSPLAPSCSEDFDDACWREHGLYVCSDPTCTFGQCTIPGPQAFLHCVSYPEPKGEQCSCTGTKSCSSMDKICSETSCSKRNSDGDCTQGTGKKC